MAQLHVNEIIPGLPRKAPPPWKIYNEPTRLYQLLIERFRADLCDNAAFQLAMISIRPRANTTRPRAV